MKMSVALLCFLVSIFSASLLCAEEIQNNESTNQFDNGFMHDIFEEYRNVWLGLMPLERQQDMRSFFKELVNFEKQFSDNKKALAVCAGLRSAIAHDTFDSSGNVPIKQIYNTVVAELMAKAILEKIKKFRKAVPTDPFAFSIKPSAGIIARTPGVFDSQDPFSPVISDALKIVVKEQSKSPDRMIPEWSLDLSGGSKEGNDQQRQFKFDLEATLFPVLDSRMAVNIRASQEYLRKNEKGAEQDDINPTSKYELSVTGKYQINRIGVPKEPKIDDILNSHAVYLLAAYDRKLNRQKSYTFIELVSMGAGYAGQFGGRISMNAAYAFTLNNDDPFGVPTADEDFGWRALGSVGTFVAGTALTYAAEQYRPFSGEEQYLAYHSIKLVHEVKKFSDDLTMSITGGATYEFQKIVEQGEDKWQKSFNIGLKFTWGS